MLLKNNLINYIKLFEKYLTSFVYILSRKYRYLILLIYDLTVVISCLLFITTFSNPLKLSEFIFILFVSFASISTYVLSGQYKSLTRYFGSNFLYLILIRNVFIVMAIFAFSNIANINISSRHLFSTYFFTISGFSTILRVLLRDILLYISYSSYRRKKKVAIYGAGTAGAQLAASLRLNKNYKIISFFDDNKKLSGRELYGILIKHTNEIKKFTKQIDQILIAIPSLEKSNFKKIVFNLQKFDIPLMQVPSIDSITKGNAKIDSLVPIRIEDLLSRDSVKPESKLMGPGIKDKVICVTGAGGSIGSELCRQLLKLKPRKLILIDQSEFNLYKIIEELTSLDFKEVQLKPVLSNISNINQLNELFSAEKINLVFHSAAYKHVPIVEQNPMMGILNNVISTKLICEASISNQVDTVLLVSTDKAVRPTNVMGVSKRLAELIIQAYAERNKDELLSTKFSMVRFGNVLDSSGSVVPLFKRQIACGGPITLTHKDIIRYFMTIEEAANLLIQSALLAKGGDLFLLDMGSPVKIYDLAIKMINLSGLKLKSDENPAGDIEIIFTGLRSGEKLYEELLIDAESKKTSHPLIFSAIEKFLPYEDLFPLILKLENLIKGNKKKETFKMLKRLVPEWQRSIEI